MTDNYVAIFTQEVSVIPRHLYMFEQTAPAIVWFYLEK